MHTKEQVKKLNNARMGRIRMWKTRAAALACSVAVGGVGDTGNLSEDISLVLRAVRVTRKERTTIPNNRI